MRVAVLDLGSNSFRLLVADVDDDGTISPVLREREMLHLGGVVAETGGVRDSALDQASNAAHHLATLAQRTGADRTIVVATAAIRESDNSDEIVTEMRQATSEDIRVLTGDEEARLAFLGVAASVSVPPGPHLVLDLGGGSLELAIGHTTDVEWTASVDLGVSRLWAETKRAEPLTADSVAYIERRVRETLEPLTDEVASRAPVAVVSVGGANRSLAQLIAPERMRWQPETLNQFLVDRQEIDELTSLLLETPALGRLKMPGMKRSRSSILPTASVIVRTTLETLGIDQTYISYWGLREGAILDTFGMTDIPTGVDLRPASIRRMEGRFSPHRIHDAHVAKLAGQIFDGLHAIHRLGAADRELLDYSARMHTIGMGVAFRSYHQHGSYLIEHSEFRGFDPTEIAILASLVRYHRRGFPQSPYQPYQALSAQDRLRVDRMVAILHLADALDRTLDQSIDKVRFDPTDTGLTIRLGGSHVALRRDWTERAGEAFRAAFDIELLFPEETISEL